MANCEVFTLNLQDQQVVEETSTMETEAEPQPPEPVEKPAEVYCIELYCKLYFRQQTSSIY